MHRVDESNSHPRRFLDGPTPRPGLGISTVGVGGEVHIGLDHEGVSAHGEQILGAV
jgi:hypothetical protein